MVAPHGIHGRRASASLQDGVASLGICALGTAPGAGRDPTSGGLLRTLLPVLTLLWGGLGEALWSGEHGWAAVPVPFLGLAQCSTAGSTTGKYRLVLQP